MNYIKQKMNKAAAIAVGTTVLAFQGSASAAVTSTLTADATEVGNKFFASGWFASAEKGLLVAAAFFLLWGGWQFMTKGGFSAAKTSLLTGAGLAILGLSAATIITKLTGLTVPVV